MKFSTNNVSIVVICLLAGGLVGCIPFDNKQPEQKSVQYPLQEFETSELNNPIPSVEYHPAEDVVRDFILSVSQATPPENNPEAARAARAMLTGTAESRVTTDAGKMSQDLTAVLGTGDVTDTQAITITSLSTSGDDQSEVIVDIRHSGGVTNRRFKVIKTGDVWKIENIQ